MKLTKYQRTHLRFAVREAAFRERCGLTTKTIVTDFLEMLHSRGLEVRPIEQPEGERNAQPVKKKKTKATFD